MKAKYIFKQYDNGFYPHESQLGEVFLFKYKDFEYLAIAQTDPGETSDRPYQYRFRIISHTLTNMKFQWLKIGNLVGCISEEDVTPISNPEKYKNYETKEYI